MNLKRVNLNGPYIPYWGYNSIGKGPHFWWRLRYIRGRGSNKADIRMARRRVVSDSKAWVDGHRTPLHIHFLPPLPLQVVRAVTFFYRDLKYALLFGGGL